MEFLEGEVIVLPTYPAILRSGRLEWELDNPPPIPLGASMRVHVTLLTDISSPDSTELLATGPAMAIALAEFAASGGPSDWGDPLEWQRESRADRNLPGRTE